MEQVEFTYRAVHTKTNRESKTKIAEHECVVPFGMVPQSAIVPLTRGVKEILTDCVNTAQTEAEAIGAWNKTCDALASGTYSKAGRAAPVRDKAERMFKEIASSEYLDAAARKKGVTQAALRKLYSAESLAKAIEDYGNRHKERIQAEVDRRLSLALPEIPDDLELPE